MNSYHIIRVDQMFKIRRFRRSVRTIASLEATAAHTCTLRRTGRCRAGQQLYERGCYRVVRKYVCVGYVIGERGSARARDAALFAESVGRNRDLYRWVAGRLTPKTRYAKTGHVRGREANMAGQQVFSPADRYDTFGQRETFIDNEPEKVRARVFGSESARA